MTYVLIILSLLGVVAMIGALIFGTLFTFAPPSWNLPSPLDLLRKRR